MVDAETGGILETGNQPPVSRNESIVQPPFRKLGVDIVMIDGAFVQNIACSAFPQASAILASLGASNVDRAFVQMLTDLARRIEIKTIAEWVQDEDLQRISPCCAASGERALTLPF